MNYVVALTLHIAFECNIHEKREEVRLIFNVDQNLILREKERDLTQSYEKAPMPT